MNPLPRMLPLVLLPLLTGAAAESVIGPRSWSIAGPYPSTSDGDLDRALPPESARDFSRGLPGPDATWLHWSEPSNGGDLHLLPPKQAEAPAIAYAVTYIDAASACRIRLRIAGDAPVRAWLDQAPIAPETAVDLAAGLHELLIKQRPARPADTLRVTCDGPTALRFLPQRPWPLRPMPTSMWLATRTTGQTLADLRTALNQPGGLGQPALPGLAWSAAAASGEALSCVGAGTQMLVGHVFIPLKYHQQEYRIRLSGVRPASVVLDGRRMDLAADGADAVGFRVPSHRLQSGFNRLAIELPADAAGSLRIDISDPGDLTYAAEVPARFLPSPPSSEWPATVISNGLVTARIAVPDDDRGLYRGNRFERAGIIASLGYKGHTYFVGAPDTPDPLNNGICYGPAEEWFDAVAWHDARLGEPFLKMGVGLYARPAHPLHMWYCAYWPQAILPWTSSFEKDTATFTQVCDGPRGWRYRYTKRLVLEPGKPVLRIEHELVNTGTQAIAGEQYNHNFILLDGRPPQAGYRCDLAFAPKPTRDIGGLARIEGRSVVMTASPDKPFGCDLAGWSDPVADQAFTVSCAGTPAAMRVEGSAPLAKLTWFAAPDYLAVEPFVAINAAPGATATWTRTYTFLAE